MRRGEEKLHCTSLSSSPLSPPPLLSPSCHTESLISSTHACTAWFPPTTLNSPCVHIRYEESAWGRGMGDLCVLRATKERLSKGDTPRQKKRGEHIQRREEGDLGQVHPLFPKTQPPAIIPAYFSSSSIFPTLIPHTHPHTHAHFPRVGGTRGSGPGNQHRRGSRLVRASTMER